MSTVRLSEFKIIFLQTCSRLGESLLQVIVQEPAGHADGDRFEVAQAVSAAEERDVH